MRRDGRSPRAGGVSSPKRPTPSGGPALDTSDPQNRPGFWSRLRGRARRHRGQREPGLAEQLGATRDAAYRLVQAHIELARTELPAIVENVKAVSIVVGVAIGFAVFALTLLSIGSFLWAGEWLFGSMGWGVVQGTALSVCVIVACVGIVLAGSRGAIVRDAVVSIVIGVVLAVVFGASLTNAGWARLTDALAPAIVPEWRLLAVAVGVSAAVLAILGLILGAIRAGLGGLIGGLIAGAVLGLAIGAFTAVSFGPQVGIALGLLGALVTFAVLQVVGIVRRGIDAAAFKARFYPTLTIETAKETLEWLREQSPAGRR